METKNKLFGVTSFKEMSNDNSGNFRLRCLCIVVELSKILYSVKLLNFQNIDHKRA